MLRTDAKSYAGKFRSSSKWRVASAGALASAIVVCVSAASAQTSLGSAQQFGVLGGSTVTNTGPSVVTGLVGVFPGSAITGFPPGTALMASHTVSQLGQSDASNAFTNLSSTATTQDLSGQDLGGKTLTPGVYSFSSSAQLTGSLFLNFVGNANSVFIFKIGSTLTTASNSSVFETGGPGANVFWLVGSSATLGTGTAFEGNIIANQSITLTTGASISCGRAIALNGAVTMDSNVISNDCGAASGPPGGSTVPEPGSMALLGTGLVGLVPFARRRRIG